jgi:DNA-binding MarR family transcriptional regulator
MANLSQENINRLKQLIQDGKSILQECEDLKGGLNDTIKAVAEELEVKPAIISRLIKDIQKNKINDKRDDQEVWEELYKAAGLG